MEFLNHSQCFPFPPVQGPVVKLPAPAYLNRVSQKQDSVDTLSKLEATWKLVFLLLWADEEPEHSIPCLPFPVCWGYRGRTSFLWSLQSRGKVNLTQPFPGDPSPGCQKKVLGSVCLKNCAEGSDASLPIEKHWSTKPWLHRKRNWEVQQWVKARATQLVWGRAGTWTSTSLSGALSTTPRPPQEVTGLEPSSPSRASTLSFTHGLL